MRNRLFHTTVTALALLGAGTVFAQCPPVGQSIGSLQALKKGAWVVDAPGRDKLDRDRLALGLLPCLADPNPVMRDEIAFEALQTWMRKSQLDTATVQTIRTRLLDDLAAPEDARGFRQPFAALTLSEVARVDRMKPFLSQAERDDLVLRGTTYLASVRDYRGFETREGWRHGVAHSADLMLQLSLNPLLTKLQVDQILAAIAQQVMPANDHFYRYGEDERLAAPVYYIARSNWLAPEAWDKWFTALVARMPRDQAASQTSLAARHNVNAFLASLYVAVRESGDMRVESALLPHLRKAIKAVG